MTQNTVDVRTIGSLLNGKNWFYVPSYQRGYRWGGKQIDDLLGDLYSFRKQFGRQSADVGQFYCLQPIIVKEIDDSSLRQAVMGEAADDASCKLWELVDGQQRLTSIYLILTYLMKKERMDAALFEDNYGAKLYTLYYESRPYTCETLAKLANGDEVEARDIDSTLLCNALQVIDKWFEDKGLEMSKRYAGGEGEKKRKMWDNLLDQIVCNSDEGPTKVIWYELANDNSIDPVQEFIRINNGKIPLTDSELVKALFMQKKNFDGSDKTLQQAKISFGWEQIENDLQRNDFWCFICNKDIEEEDRMGELLKLVYLKKDTTATGEIETGDIFRYYYNELDGLAGAEMRDKVDGLWAEIIDTFRTLQDWYESPEIYNYVGFLVQSGMPLAEIYAQHVELKQYNENGTVDDFLVKLEEDIRHILPKGCVDRQDKDHPRIVTEYKDRAAVRRILLLLNVDMLSRQLKEIRKQEERISIGDANVFKFPFGLYRGQQWDIEHIDSATTNTLRDNESRKAWVMGSIKDAHMEITPAIEKKMEAGEWEELMGIVKTYEGEDAEDKNFIGNLTLLDSSTNREYGNSLFCQKRSYIIGKIMNGRYVLPCTQHVFMKFFDDEGTTESRTRWTKDDKEKYHDFIITQLHRFLINQ